VTNTEPITLAHAKARRLVRLPSGELGTLVFVSPTTGRAKVRRLGRHESHPLDGLVLVDHPGAWPDLAALEQASTLATGQAADLKLDDGSVRVWLARTTSADGEPYEHTAHVEALCAEGWRHLLSYDATDPPTVTPPK